jgi:UDP-N-acetylglucosamine 4-epimerase
MLKDIDYTGHHVLVTGAAGFIGSNLVEWLLSNGNSVVGLDNFSTGKKENIAPFLSHHHFSFIEGDIRDFATCQRACQSVEAVLHQAALGSVPRSIKNPLLSTEVNILGTANMFFAAAESDVNRVVYAASSSTYGDSPHLPKVEERIGRPLSPYAITKYVNELYADNFSRFYNIETVGLRYFNVYGRRQDPKGAYAAVIPLFIRQILNGEQVTINGDGLHARDFTYIDNVIEANIRSLLATKEAVNTVYNVACGEKTTLNELFSAIADVVGSKNPELTIPKPHYGPSRPGDVRESLASIEKARLALGYDPEFFFREGIRQTIDWYIRER